MSEVVDLDALMPQPVQVKFDNQVIDVPPPATGDILRMASLFRKVREDDLSQTEQDQRVVALTQHIYRMIPVINDKPLTFSQIIALVNILDDMALPPDTKAAAKNRITTDAPKE